MFVYAQLFTFTYKADKETFFSEYASEKRHLTFFLDTSLYRYFTLYR